MIKWEYLQHVDRASQPFGSGVLHAIGTEGWELVSIQDLDGAERLAIFKRPIRPTAPGPDPHIEPWRQNMGKMIATDAALGQRLRMLVGKDAAWKVTVVNDQNVSVEGPWRDGNPQTRVFSADTLHEAMHAAYVAKTGVAP